jgi:hypothetical protein
VRAAIASRYGLVKPIESHHPIRIAFHPLSEMENAMQPMIFGVALVATLACAAMTSAIAQTPAPDTAGKMPDFSAKIAARFAAADANHDGRLTREEAEGKMPMVARSFDQIDKAHRGYVTQEDIQAFMRERLSQHRGGAQGATD